jgi:hypothetical protein
MQMVKPGSLLIKSSNLDELICPKPSPIWKIIQISESPPNVIFQ